MSGELQTIPARHGVATFVPRGRTIKVINTYGKQVVSMWAFALGAPPEEGDDEPNAEDIEREAQEMKQAAEEEETKEVPKEESKEEKKPDGPAEESDESPKQKDETTEENKEATPDQDDPADDPPEQAPDTPESEKPAEASAKQPSKRTWASYLPSIPYRSKGSANKSDAEQKPDKEAEKAQNEANTKKWSSYLPTGKGISNYVPNVQVPDTKGVVSAFKSSHYRDPNKSYAEQLYDFSKTPVGAGTIAAATGSGYASSVYAAYNAYATTHPSNSAQAPMEYLSLPHTRASSHKLVPAVDDTLLTNLRNPIVTLVEDTTPGAHDTLTAACDANLYAALGVDKPAEHGSCAENLVLALKELNEEAGLKGAKAIGADISVNIAPTPLHLFMVAPIVLDGAKSETAGAGAKGATIRVDEPKGKKRSFVRFKAERDIVLVFSACPMDVGSQNGGRCMAANFMVEDAEAETEKDNKGKTEKKPATKKASEKSEKSDSGVDEKTADKKDAEKSSEPETPKDVSSGDSTPAPTDKTETKGDDNAKPDAATEEAPKPKKKPKKLEVRKKPAAGSS